LSILHTDSKKLKKELIDVDRAINLMHVVKVKQGGDLEDYYRSENIS